MLQAVIYNVGGVDVARGFDQLTVVVERWFVLELNAQRAFVECHVAFDQQEVHKNTDVVVVGMNNCLVDCNSPVPWHATFGGVPSGGGVDTLILCLFLSWSAFQRSA